MRFGVGGQEDAGAHLSAGARAAFLSRKVAPPPLPWRQGALLHSCPRGEGPLLNVWRSWPVEAIQPALSPGHTGVRRSSHLAPRGHTGATCPLLSVSAATVLALWPSLAPALALFLPPCRLHSAAQVVSV